VARARRAVAEFRIRGVATNIPFLQALLDDPDFRAGRVTTSFIDEHPQLLTTRSSADSLRARASDEKVEGNLEHGAELFHGTARCSECHMIRGNGGLLGPDLSNIGAERTLRQLREALTTVRPNIPFGFQPVRIRAKSGETVDGIIKNENKNKEKVQFVVDAVKESGGIEYATAKMLAFRDEALKLLYEFDESAARNALEDLVRFTTDRNY